MQISYVSNLTLDVCGSRGYRSEIRPSLLRLLAKKKKRNVPIVSCKFRSICIMTSVCMYAVCDFASFCYETLLYVSNIKWRLSLHLVTTIKDTNMAKMFIFTRIIKANLSIETNRFWYKHFKAFSFFMHNETFSWITFGKQN